MYANTNSMIIFLLFQDDDRRAVCPNDEESNAQSICKRNIMPVMMNLSGGDSSSARNTSPKKFKKPTEGVKRRKTMNSLNYENVFKNLHEIIDRNKEDEFESFGNYVASQLRQLPIGNALRMQQKFHNMLVEERIQCLGMTSLPQTSSVSSISGYNVISPIGSYTTAENSPSETSLTDTASLFEESMLM